MSLSPEWKRRIEAWHKQLPVHFYRKLQSVQVEGFETLDHILYDEAMSRKFNPMPKGTKWGEKWAYGWFRTSFTLPEEAAGKRIVFYNNVGSENAIYVNGRNFGAKDRQHENITLAMSGVPGTRYDIVSEAYAGHGTNYNRGRPVPPGDTIMTQVYGLQNEVGDVSFGIWEEVMYQLWLDVETLYQVRNNLDPDSLRLAEIDKGLKDFTLIMDFEVSYEVMIETAEKSRERLKPLLECKNGSTAPVMYAFGNSHIDVAWLWTFSETQRKCSRTFPTQLELMKEYPEFVFLQSQPHLLLMVKQNYPALYEELKEAVKKGTFIVEGGMYVEPDVNLSGGESLIRQFIYGRKFFMDEFGVDTEMLWLPDVFGYTGSLPQIMKGCKVKYFATSKLFWNYNGSEPFPYNTFMWEGIDGTEVLAHLYKDYSTYTDPNTIILRWNERVQKDDISTRMYPYGYGDGGGGVTRNHLEFVRRCKDLEGVPKMKTVHPLDFFKDIEKTGLPENKYVGELYFACHRGTLTSQARTKRSNRKSELLMRELEMLGTAAELTAAKAFPYEEVSAIWQVILLNQFHDIIPGSSIGRVYEEAEASYAEIRAKMQKIIADTGRSLVSGNGTGFIAFNSLSWARKGLVAVPAEFADGSYKFTDATGKALTAQSIEGTLYVAAQMPSCGWIAVNAVKGVTAAAAAGTAAVKAYKDGANTVLENSKLKATFDAHGEMCELLDKERSTQLLHGKSNKFRMYKDVPTMFDAWDIDDMYYMTPVDLEDAAEVTIEYNGALEAAIRISKKLNNSTLTQVVALGSESRQIDFRTKINYQEGHKLLKVDFDVDYHTNEMLNEIQFGHISRPNHKSKISDADRFEVSNHKWSAYLESDRGFAVMNDCKYGISALDNTISLTLLKSGLSPDEFADRGDHEFTYSIYPWNGSFDETDMIRKSYELNVPATSFAGMPAIGSQSLFGVSAENVIIETVKPAEDRSGDIVIRLYEAKRKATKVTLDSAKPIKKAWLCNMLEDNISEITAAAGKNAVQLSLKPFEIVTLRLEYQR